jgi:adenylate kinase
MRGVLGITGTPGTGKKSVAPLVAAELGVPCVGLDEVAVSPRGRRGEAEVDPRVLRRELTRRVAPPAVVYGHLLPYALERRLAAKVVVLRCEPSVLKERLRSRGYGEQKVRDNVEAELIGTILFEALKAYGRRKVSEVDTTCSTPAEAASEVVSAARGGPPRTPIDWLPGYDSAKLTSLLR